VRLQRAFWWMIAAGDSTEDAAAQVCVSNPVGLGGFACWRHDTDHLAEPGGRCLLFREREEIALLRVQGHGVRALAHRLGRNPGTI
jgi:hypothetical protein